MGLLQAPEAAVLSACPLCQRAAPPAVLAEVDWLSPRAIEELARTHPRWVRPDGACPACVQEALLTTLLLDGREALGGRIQDVWPLDAGAAFGAIPTPLRLRANPRYSGRGVGLALVDAGFFPHPDLVRPENRIAVWVDASREPVVERWFSADDVPSWPWTDEDVSGQWHGLMTSVTAAGNGWMSHGLYRGLASSARLALVQVRREGRITNRAIARGLVWLGEHAALLDLRVVSLSVAGEEIADRSDDVVDRTVSALTASGVVVVAAAGNDGDRRLLPPATSFDAITVGGLDDRNTVDRTTWEIWHSNYGSTPSGVPKPEVVAPSIWTVAPVLPGTNVAVEAQRLFEHRHDQADPTREARIGALHLVTPHYQHVEGTSFAAPVVASAVACMVEAHPQLSAARVKELLMGSAVRVAGASDERQGAGAVDAGLAVAAALAEGHPQGANFGRLPHVSETCVTFMLHDHHATCVRVLGSWNGWQTPGLVATRAENGLWRAELSRPLPGRYAYKFLLNEDMWLADPANPVRIVDEAGRVNSAFDV